jgi:hypothetical protein
MIAGIVLNGWYKIVLVINKIEAFDLSVNRSVKATVTVILEVGLTLVS